jgi:hypothetical protein
MLETVLFAPLRFHDTTSRGRLLNRFGKDIEGLDSEMADHCELLVYIYIGSANASVVRSLSYGGDVLVTFISIAYIGGWPFVVATGYVTNSMCNTDVQIPLDSLLQIWYSIATLLVICRDCCWCLGN